MWELSSTEDATCLIGRRAVGANMLIIRDISEQKQQTRKQNGAVHQAKLHEYRLHPPPSLCSRWPDATCAGRERISRFGGGAGRDELRYVLRETADIINRGISSQRPHTIRMWMIYQKFLGQHHLGHAIRSRFETKDSRVAAHRTASRRHAEGHRGRWGDITAVFNVSGNDGSVAMSPPPGSNQKEHGSRQLSSSPDSQPEQSPVGPAAP
ncbi:hypothetical protein CPLU01_04616 [Colletotrichum plurivorum]|uniref:Uncharacterized protein n=1 Tax=Colletotrichum plurivorum TaxID=2175906 RepID=A0A8H6KNP8_9PEZI|nr:hypothetical protein CPLU01_04616 [Colletotrichum plurivorum]